MKTTKYRILFSREDYYRCKCISCRENFDILDNNVYNFCPKCGLPTRPEKVRQKYFAPFNYPKVNLDVANLFSEEKILLLLTASTIKQELGDGFYYVNLSTPKKSSWNVHSWSRLNSIVNNKSSSHYFIKKFNELCEKEQHVKLVLLYKNNVKVIKEK